MKAGILQPSYLPWLGYLEQMARTDVFVCYDDVQFEKGSWRNRNRIKSAIGIQWLTVPVLTKNLGQQALCEVVINDRVNWQQKHIRTITQNYRRAPYFDQYADLIFEIIGRPWRYLVDLNLTLLAWLQATLEIETVTYRSSEIGIPGHGTQRLIAILNHLGAETFYEGQAGKNYINEVDFRRAGLRLKYQDYQHPSYPQMHGDFVPYLSVIDLLFNVGPHSLNIIMRRD